MDESTFWDLIADAVRTDGSFDEKVDALEDRLRALPPEEIEGFYLRYDERLSAAWRPELGLVAYLANHPLRHGGEGRCDADDLLVFACWLIDQGREVFEATLRDPDSLADYPEDPPWQSEGLWFAAELAWKTHRRGSFYDAIGGRAWPQDYPGGGTVEDRELARRFPRLVRRFLGPVN